MVTQCPVIAHSNFEYRFVAQEYGTHMWHAHSGLQRADGVFGSLVVRQYPKDNAHIDKYDYDLPEHIMVLNDWINDTSISKFASHHHNDGDNKPSSILINGKGVLFLSVHNGAEYETPRALFRVRAGFRYRFRVINAGFLYCPMEISIDNHNLTVIASDGKSLEPLEVESLIIYAGERYDFILSANQAVKSHWIKVKGFADCSVFKVYEKAILSYNDVTEKPEKKYEVYKNASRAGLVYK